MHFMTCWIRRTRLVKQVHASNPQIGHKREKLATETKPDVEPATSRSLTQRYCTCLQSLW